MSNLNSDGPLREVVREIWKRKTFLLVSLIILYPIWIWPFPGVILRFLLKETSPGMSPQDENLVIAWNSFIDLFVLQAHPDIFEAYVDAKVYYRLAGRPDLARRVEVIGPILIWWGFFSKFYAIFMFPLLVIYPYLPMRYKIKRWNLVLITLFAFLVYAFLGPLLLYELGIIN